MWLTHIMLLSNSLFLTCAKLNVQSANRNRYPEYPGIPSDQWSNSSSNARFRSGSMSSGMNNMLLQRPPNGSNKFNMQDGIPPRPNISTSVFDLNQVGQRPQQFTSGYNPGVMPNVINSDVIGPSPTQFDKNLLLYFQAPSHGSCINCSQQQLHNWNQQMVNPVWESQVRNLNGSNMSLNLPPHAYYPQQVGWAPPNMYPYPVGMVPIINQGVFTLHCKEE